MATATQEVSQPKREVDPAKTEEFAAKVVGNINGFALALMTSIGHQTGLFDAMAGQAPATSQEVADRTVLNERYVREWLAAMTTGGIVLYDPKSKTYELPDEHAASLTRAAGPGNLAAIAELLPEISSVEQGVVRSFREGGGVGYSEFPRFQRLMAQLSAQVFDATLVESTLTLVPGLVECLEQGMDVADVGTGAGHAVNVMAKAFPNSRFVGFDFSEEGIALGRKEADEMGLANAAFDVLDVSEMDIKERFDAITVFDAIHDQARPAAVLDNIYKALKPGGVLFCVDIAGSSNLEENMGHPLAPYLYTVSTMHCMTVSLALGGAGLGTMWGEQKAIQMLRDAGFSGIETKQVEGDIFNNYYVARKR